MSLCDSNPQSQQVSGRGYTLSKFLKKQNVSILVNLFVKMTYRVLEVYGNCPENTARVFVQPNV
jgi:hypothetical protein